MKIIITSGILLFGLALIFSCHYFIYSTAIKFLDITNSKTKIALVISLAILSVSFIATSILVHWLENDITRSLYLAAGIWMGLLTYLLVSSLTLWLLLFLSRQFNFGINFKIITFLLIAISFLAAGFGIWNAKKIVIKEIEAPIKNLPAEWENKVLIQISDVHLGVVNRPDFIQRIVQDINQQQPEAVFITGDYFDGMDGRLDDLTEPLNNINAPKGIYFVTGNHETYLGVEKVISALKPTKIVLMDDNKVDLGGISLVGINYPLIGEKKNVAEIVKEINPKHPSILLYHIPRQIDQIKGSGIDLMLSGHTHRGQIWPYNYITKIIFGKYYYGLNIEDEFTQYTSSGVGTWGPLMRTANRPEIVKIILKNK